MKRLLGLIGICVLGGLLLVAMVTWLDYQAVRAQTPPPGCETINSDISSPTEVWSLARAPCYRITTSTVAIQPGAWLTIEAGVEVYFDAGSRLQISQNGFHGHIRHPGVPVKKGPCKIGCDQIAERNIDTVTAEYR